MACGEEANDRLGGGLAGAPAGFGTFSTGLLAGTSGDRRISAFGPATGAFHGHLHDSSGHPVTINRLRGLAFGNGGRAGDTTTLSFAVGLTDESGGLFGTPPARKAQRAWRGLYATPPAREPR